MDGVEVPILQFLGQFLLEKVIFSQKVANYIRKCFSPTLTIG